MYSHTPLAPLFALVPALGLCLMALLMYLRVRGIEGRGAGSRRKSSASGTNGSSAREARSTSPSRRGGLASDSGGLRTADLVWAALPALVLVWAIAWCCLGFMTASVRALGVLTAACLGAGAVALWRERILAPFEGSCSGNVVSRGTVLRLAKNVLCLGVATWFSFLALETPWNAIAGKLPATSVALECALIGLALLGCYLLAQRHGGGGLVTVCAAAGIGLAQYFLAMFKGTAILPSDVLGIGTAMAVSQSYTYFMSSTALEGITYAVLAGTVLSLARRLPTWKTPTQAAGKASESPARKVSAHYRPHHVRAALVHTIAGIAALAACLALFTVPSYRNDFGIYIPDYWWALNRYSEYGFIPTFASAVQDLPIAKPDGYSDDEASQLEASYAQAQENQGRASGHATTESQFAQNPPSIVAIMNESYSDLSLFKGLDGSYAGPSLVTSPPAGTLAQGNLAVSVLGGGTCNSEFEFLTGTSIDFVGDGKYPYTLYNFSDAPSLARQLQQLGYHTTAIHPNKATNWNRDRVYAQMGFEDTQFEDSFAGAEQYHAGVSDAQTYQHVLNVLNSSSTPQFVFDVTMQNHSGYDTGKIPEDERLDLALPSLNSSTASEVDEYLACINESDHALNEFLDDLRELDRPVVVVFFGDHQPFFTPQLNDAYFPGEDGIEHTERTHQTPYLVWANYDVAGKSSGAGDGLQTKPTGASQLAAQALWSVGAPLTSYQEAVLGASQRIPAFNALGYLDAKGTWHPHDEDNPTLDDLARIEYLEFARKVE